MSSTGTQECFVIDFFKNDLCLDQHTFNLDDSGREDEGTQ